MNPRFIKKKAKSKTLNVRKSKDASTEEDIRQSEIIEINIISLQNEILSINFCTN